MPELNTCGGDSSLPIKTANSFSKGYLGATRTENFGEANLDDLCHFECYPTVGMRSITVLLVMGMLLHVQYTYMDDSL